jgi:hypothetical protein
MTTEARSPRYERVGAYLIEEIEKSKPSQSPDAYPVLDSYLTGFENGLERAQHIIEVSARYALAAALASDSTPEQPE